MGCTCEDEPQLGCTLQGITFGTGHTVSKCAQTMHNALCNRHAKKQPPLLSKISSYIATEFVGDITGKYRELLLDVSQQTDPIDSHYSNVWNDRFSLNKRTANIKSLAEEPSRPEKVEPFIKREVNKDKYPEKGRCIQAYKTKSTGTILGPEYYSFQKATSCVDSRTFIISGTVCHVTIASGMNHDDIGRWMDKAAHLPGKVKFYERDGKTWDATMRHEHLDMVNDLMRECDPELAKHNKECYDVSGRYTYRQSSVKYSVVGTRKSGHNDTSSGNSLINAEIAVAAAAECCFEEIMVIVMGDDMLMAISNPPDNYVESMIVAEKQYGIVPEAGGFENPLEVTFISARWYPRFDHTFAFGPIIAKQLVGLFWTVKTMPSKHREKWVSSVARSFLVPFKGCPIMDVFLRTHITTSDDYEIEKYVKKLRPMVDVDWDTYFLTRYGLTRTETQEVEEQIMDLRGKGPCVINSTIVQDMKVVDFADPGPRPKCLF